MRPDYVYQMIFWILVGMFMGYLWKGLNLIIKAFSNDWPY